MVQLLTGQILPAGQTSQSLAEAAPNLSMTKPGGHDCGSIVPENQTSGYGSKHRELVKFNIHPSDTTE